MRIKETRDVAHMIERVEAQGGSVDIATEINASSTNEEAAGAKAVYDFVGASVPNMLELNVEFSGSLPATVTIEDEGDIAKLEAE